MSSRYEFEEDELVWFGQVDTPTTTARVIEEDKAEEPKRETAEPTWDSPSDILYCHAESEDYGLCYASDPTAECSRKVFKHDVPQLSYKSHPASAHRAFDETTLRVIREPYDASTWDSPTDILYSHACEDNDEIVIIPSALGIVLDEPCPPLVAQAFRRNRYGAIREPYNAATWDSPTDILYAHQSHDEEEDDSESTDEEAIQTPRVFTKPVDALSSGKARADSFDSDYAEETARHISEVVIA